MFQAPSPVTLPTQDQRLAASSTIQSNDKFRPHPVYWESTASHRLVKAVMVGTSNAGKSNIARMFKGLSFEDKYRPSNGVEFVHKDYPADTRFQIWDMPGDDRFAAISSGYFKSCHVFIIVFDVTDLASWENIEKIEKNMDKASKPWKTILVIGNKCDLPDRKINFEQADSFCRERNYLYMDMSCKDEQIEGVQKKLDELLYSHLALAMPINNFSDDNWARNIYGIMYKEVLAQYKELHKRKVELKPVYPEDWPEAPKAELKKFDPYYEKYKPKD